MSAEAASGRPRGFRAGVSFLTRIPVSSAIGERDIAASVAWFPVVGALVGAMSGAVYLLASKLWPSPIAAILAVGTSIAITGAFHEDGLGDTADAFGAASTGRDPQAVLKDPRMGALGVSAGVVVSAPSASTGLGSSYAVLAPRWRGMVAAIVGFLVATICLGVGGPLSLIAAIVAAMIVTGWAERTLDGVSGDVLGAIEQLGKITTLLVVVALSAQGFPPAFAR